MVYLVSGSSFEAADPAVSRKLERDLAACKVVLGKCEAAIEGFHESTCEQYWDSDASCSCSLQTVRAEALAEIAKLRGGAK